jgi:hypothetical protein
MVSLQGLSGVRVMVHGIKILAREFFSYVGFGLLMLWLLDLLT